MTLASHPSAVSYKPAYEDLQQAAQWFALLQAQSVSDTDRQRWAAWLDQGQGQRAAWQQVESVAEKFSALSHLPARQILEGANAVARRRRRTVVRMMAVLPVTGLAGWMVEREVPWRGWRAAHRTRTGERRELVLDDGSRVWLNTASSIDIDFTASQRRIVLHRGEVLITTGHDPAWYDRPLTVDVEEGRITALGTRFSVRRGDDAGDPARVTVFEGAVRSQPSHGDQSRILQAGQEANLYETRTGPAEATEAGSDSWTRGLLVANDRRLGDFVEDLNRYREGHLACAPEVQDLRIVGSYPLQDTDRILTALQSTLPVRVRKILPWWVVIEAAPSRTVR